MFTAAVTKTINGYNVIAHEFKARDGVYVILGERTTDFGHMYVTGYVNNIDSDMEWYWGNYFHNDIVGAVEDFKKRSQ
jgi:hypothetical protein